MLRLAVWHSGTFGRSDWISGATFTEEALAWIAPYRVVLIGLVVLILVGTTAAAQTSDRSWVLEKGEGFKTLKDSPASLTLNDKQLSGSTGCNTFRATLSERAEKRVAINDVALTRKLCAPPASDNERAIVQAFNKTEFVEEKADTLTFFSGTRETLLVWKPVKQSGSVRAATVPRLDSATPHVTKAKSARKHRSARTLKASRRHLSARGLKASRSNTELTEFPWPPPLPSSEYVISNSYFAGMKTVGSVANHIIEALDQRGYTERSFYSAENGGIVLVTRLERIDDQGISAHGSARWRAAFLQRTRFAKGLVDFLAGLFYADPGYYRVIVFVIGGEAFKAGERRATEEEALEWLTKGMSNLPRSVRLLPFDPEEEDCTALVYEFVNEDVGREAKVVKPPGKLPAQTHLDASGLLRALGKHN